MPSPVEFELNGRRVAVEIDADVPLLYVLRNDLDQHGPRFGCGLAQCGACTVHVDGKAVRSCVYPVAAVAGHRVTTLDGLAAAYRDGHAGLAGVASDALHPVQQAFIDEQASQCGYCMNAWVMTAAAVLAEKPEATDRELREGLSGLKCRCGTQVSVLRAVKLAAANLRSSGQRS